MSKTRATLNGFEVCDLLRSGDPTKYTPIILMTGYHEKREYVESLDADLLFFMEKPFENKELLSTIRAALDSPSDSEERLTKP